MFLFEFDTGQQPIVVQQNATLSTWTHVVARGSSVSWNAALAHGIARGCPE